MDACVNNNKAKSQHQKLCSVLFAKKKEAYLTSPASQCRKNARDGAEGLSPLSEKTRMSIVCRCHSKGSIFSSVILKVLFRFVLCTLFQNTRSKFSVKWYGRTCIKRSPTGNDCGRLIQVSQNRSVKNEISRCYGCWMKIA